MVNQQGGVLGKSRERPPPKKRKLYRKKSVAGKKLEKTNGNVPGW